ncbi:MAG: monovalent cation/H+ antiporter subunit D family protein, partial [Deltaproteobacteria bacterium]|nr:monovalent cation/H+ antiporter subunit D family protein [Deltaproteobacteria bacterium]
IFVATGIKNISQMDGIGKRMPITMAAFFIGSLSVIGLPPCGGFISKWHLVLGTLDAGQLALLAVILVSSLLNAAYFLPIVYNAFFNPLKETSGNSSMDEAPIWCLIPICITAIGSIVLFFHPEPFLSLAQMAAKVYLSSKEYR